jgi:FkbM family methyltransferase
MQKIYKGWFGEFCLDPEIDFYGDSYWQAVSSKAFEPDTMAFLESNLNSRTDFIDVGAATGAMSIIAGKLGSRVLSFEAVPRVYEIAKAHIDSNPEIRSRILMRNCAISSQPGTLELGRNSDPNVLASISNEEPNDLESAKVPIVSLIHEIDSFHQQENKLVIKVDIEGAEWKLLSDKKTLKGLSRHNAQVLLAIHPGFNRPFKALPLGLTFLTKKYWQLQNLVIAYRFFRTLLKVATIQRTSLDKIPSTKKCLLLMFGGYFEFILNFKENS